MNYCKNLLFVSIMLIGFSSCDKAEEEKSNIVGRWKVVSQSAGEWTESFEDYSAEYIYEFKSDGTCAGNVGVLEIIPIKGFWTLTGDALKISGPDYKVAKLDAQNLILHYMFENKNYIELVFKRVE